MSPAIARPLHPPPKFGDAAGQQGEQARQAERAEQGEQQRQASETLPSEAQLREQQECEEQQGGMGGKDQQMADSQGVPGQQDGGSAAALPRGVRKRLRGDEQGVQQDGKRRHDSRGSGGTDSPPVSAGAAAAALAAAVAAAGVTEDGEDGVPEGAATPGATGAPAEERQQQQQQQQQQQARGPAAAAAPADGSRSGGSPSAGAKRLLREPSAGLAQRPWQEQDVLAFTSADHPFHGITRERRCSQKMRCVGGARACPASPSPLQICLVPEAVLACPAGVPRPAAQAGTHGCARCPPMLPAGLPDGCVAAQFVLKLSNGKPLEGGR